MQYLMLRAFFLPGKVTPEQTAFYVDLLKKVSQTAEYKDYMEKQALKPIFLDRQRNGEVPRGGRQAEQEPDDRSRLRREVTAQRPAPLALLPAEGACKRRASIYDRGPMATPETKSRRRSGAPKSSPPVVGTRAVNIVVYLLLLALAALLAYDNWRTGMGWARRGPRPAISRSTCRSCWRRQPLWPRLRAGQRRGVGETFRHARPASPCHAGLRPDPAVLSVHPMARTLRRELPADRRLHVFRRPYRAVEVAAHRGGVLDAMFATFDIAFDVIMPKGPLEAAFGY